MMTQFSISQFFICELVTYWKIAFDNFAAELPNVQFLKYPYLAKSEFNVFGLKQRLETTWILMDSKFW